MEAQKKYFGLWAGRKRPSWGLQVKHNGAIRAFYFVVGDHNQAVKHNCKLINKENTTRQIYDFLSEVFFFNSWVKNDNRVLFSWCMTFLSLMVNYEENSMTHILIICKAFTIRNVKNKQKLAYQSHGEQSLLAQPEGETKISHCIIRPATKINTDFY